jgi:hypothetical protein
MEDIMLMVWIERTDLAFVLLNELGIEYRTGSKWITTVQMDYRDARALVALLHEEYVHCWEA